MKKRRLLSFMLLMSLIVGLSSTLTSCKDDDDDAGWKEKFETDNRTLTDALKGQIAALQQCQTTCQTKQSELQNQIDQLTSKLGTLESELRSEIGSKADTAQISALQTEINNTNVRITNLENTMTSIQSDLEGKIRRGDSILNAAIIAQQGAIDAATGRITKNEEDIAKLQGDLADAINQNNAAIAEINGKIDGINTTISTIQGDITNINSTLGDINTKIGNINTTITQIQGDITTINNSLSTLSENLTNLTNTVNQYITAYDSKFADLYRKAANDSAAIAQARSIADEADSIAKAAIDSITRVSGQVAEVKDLAESNAQAIDILKGRVDALEALVTKIENALRQQVTSINVNGTYNPIYGYYAVPTGDVRSTILGTYYGNVKAFQFPTANSGYYADAESRLSSEDINITGTTPQNHEAGTIVAEDGANGNAGTMYLTLNPTNVDLSGKAFTLVNSQNAESGMALSNAEPSNELLSFGYTRAGGNGFYETKGTVSADQVENLKPNVNLNDIKDEVRTLYHNWKNRSTNGGFSFNASQLAGVIYENINNVLPALALKTTWTDDYGEKSVLSQYSVGAAAVHPLSFGFLQGRTYTPLPVYTAYEDLNVKVDTITIGSITTPTVQVTITIKGSQGQDSTVTTTVDGLNQLIDQINSQLTGVQSQVNNQIKDADSEIERLSRLTSLIKTYDRWANRVNGWFSRDGNNNINRSLQPVLFYGQGNELRKVGNAKYGTVALPSGSSLLATTYTLELLAPAYEKWIAVTNVWPNSDDAVRGRNSAQQGNATAKSALTAANSGENMNTIVFGNTRHVTLGTLQRGYVYEISYAAVDYNGKNVVRKFYVRGE